MSPPVLLEPEFAAFRSALGVVFPDLLGELRPPVPFEADFLHRPGAEQLRSLWSLTSGQVESALGVAGGLRLLGPVDSQEEREKWAGLMTSGVGLEAIANPSWDASDTLDPEAVRGVYFAAGWVPVLTEPMEANYLAVDLVPLPGGHPGQIVLCGRDEDEKCVVAPDLAQLFRGLAQECRDGAWELHTENSPGKSGKGQFQWMGRRLGRLLSGCKGRDRSFPLRAG